MLFGRIEPGGMVNIVTKKPQEEAYYSLQQQFGSYDFTGLWWMPLGLLLKITLCSTGLILLILTATLFVMWLSTNGYLFHLALPSDLLMRLK